MRYDDIAAKLGSRKKCGNMNSTSWNGFSWLTLGMSNIGAPRARPSLVISSCALAMNAPTAAIGSSGTCMSRSFSITATSVSWTMPAMPLDSRA